MYRRASRARTDSGRALPTDNCPITAFRDGEEAVRTYVGESSQPDMWSTPGPLNVTVPFNQTVAKNGHVATCLSIGSVFSIEHTTITPRSGGRKTMPVVRGPVWWHRCELWQDKSHGRLQT
jgi:hypothetical protein